MPRFPSPASRRARATEPGFDAEKATRAELRGDRTSASRVDRSCLPNRSYPPEDPCFNFAIPGKPHATLSTTVPSAAFRDLRRDRMAHGIGHRQRERFASHHSSKVNSVCAPTLGLAAPFSVRPRRCATRISRKRYCGWAKCIPVGSAESTVTRPVERRGRR